MSDWQLFIDDFVIARSTGFDRIIHHPHPKGTVIDADKPWETSGVSPMHVERRSDGSFVAYYSAMWWDIDGAGELPPGFREDRAHHIFHRIAYAESEDGINWNKPDLGLVEAPAGVDPSRHPPYPSPDGKSTHNNLGVPFVIVADLGTHGNVQDPTKRYALRLAPGTSRDSPGVGASWSEQPDGYFASELPDFVGDSRWREKLSRCDGEFNPRRKLLQFWDDKNEEWVAMDQGVTPHWLPSREIARFSSKDLNKWESMAALYPDSLDPSDPGYYDEPMTLTPFFSEGVVFGLLSWFHSDRTYPWGGPNLEATEQNPVRWPWCRKGTNEMRITISRDGGKTWDRTSSREAWIPHGSEEDSYDRLVISPTPPVRVGDEDWFYMGVMDGDHLNIRNDPENTPYVRDRPRTSRIALYVQKHNRYVSLSSGNTAEILITRPVVVDGSRLQLNLDASRGWVRVGLAHCDPVMTFGNTTPSTAPHLLEENMLPGFHLEDCIPINANDTEYEVAFENGPDLTPLHGREVVLFLESFNSDLYGFRFFG
jgi:hypothetical protein